MQLSPSEINEIVFTVSLWFGVVQMLALMLIYWAVNPLMQWALNKWVRVVDELQP